MMVIININNQAGIDCVPFEDFNELGDKIFLVKTKIKDVENRFSFLSLRGISNLNNVNVFSSNPHLDQSNNNFYQIRDWTNTYCIEILKNHRLELKQELEGLKNKFTGLYCKFLSGHEAIIIDIRSEIYSIRNKKYEIENKVNYLIIKTEIRKLRIENDCRIPALDSKISQEERDSLAGFQQKIALYERELEGLKQKLSDVKQEQDKLHKVYIRILTTSYASYT